MSKLTINILGCRTSTTLLLQATSDIQDLSTCKLRRLVPGNACLPLCRFTVLKPSSLLIPWYHPARGYMETPDVPFEQGFKVVTRPEIPPAALMAQSAVLYFVPSAKPSLLGHLALLTSPYQLWLVLFNPCHLRCGRNSHSYHPPPGLASEEILYFSLVRSYPFS